METSRSQTEMVPLEDVRPGMVLGDDLYGPSGAMLLKRGELLSSRKISWLRERGVEDVPVASSGPAPGKGQGGTDPGRALQDRFRRVADEPLMKEILDGLLDLFSPEDAR